MLASSYCVFFFGLTTSRWRDGYRCYDALSAAWLAPRPLLTFSVLLVPVAACAAARWLSMFVLSAAWLAPCAPLTLSVLLCTGCPVRCGADATSCYRRSLARPGSPLTPFIILVPTISRCGATIADIISRARRRGAMGRCYFVPNAAWLTFARITLSARLCTGHPPLAQCCLSWRGSLARLSLASNAFRCCFVPATACCGAWLPMLLRAQFGSPCLPLALYLFQIDWSISHRLVYLAPWRDRFLYIVLTLC